MGKTGGFLEYQRMERPAKAPDKRVSCFREFHRELTKEERRAQGARCMNCGVPFCQSDFGCPLHNLIPEWNDEVYSGNWEHGLTRLLKTNNFPEFTGRVCPALCEKACICGIYDDPVTVRDNELALIEAAFEEGWMTPVKPSVRSGKKIAVIGSGPAGLAAADQLNHRGHSVTVYERDELPGGLLMYGIPNMKLDKSIVLRRIQKMMEEGIAFICSTEVGKDIGAEELKETYDAVILSCGAREPRVLEAQKAQKEDIPGVAQALDYLTVSTKAVLSGENPLLNARDRRVLVVGNGDTASDCVATAVRQGAVSVRQLVRKPAPEAGSAPDYAREEAEAVYGTDPKLYETVITEFHRNADGQLASVTVRTAGREQELPAELVIVAAGFAGAESGIAEAFGLSLDSRRRLGDEEYRTAAEGVFACGDMRRGPSLVVWAIAEGRACARAVDEYLEGYSYL